MPVGGVTAEKSEQVRFPPFVERWAIVLLGLYAILPLLGGLWYLVSGSPPYGRPIGALFLLDGIAMAACAYGLLRFRGVGRAMGACGLLLAAAQDGFDSMATGDEFRFGYLPLATLLSLVVFWVWSARGRIRMHIINLLPGKDGGLNQ